MTGPEYTRAKLSFLQRWMPLFVALALAGLSHAALVYFWSGTALLPRNSSGGASVSVSIQHLKPTPDRATAESARPSENQAQSPDTPAATTRSAKAQPDIHSQKQPDTLSPAPGDTEPASNQAITAGAPSPTSSEAEARQADTTPALPATPAQSPRPSTQQPLQATPLSGQLPRYPALAIRRQQEGKVQARLWLSKTGKVERYEIIRSSDHRLLDRSVIEFIEKERFAPAHDGTAPIASEQIFSFEFQLR